MTEPNTSTSWASLRTDSLVTINGCHEVLLLLSSQQLSHLSRSQMESLDSSHHRAAIAPALASAQL